MYTINPTIIFFIILSLQRGFFGNGLSCHECRSVSASRQCISDVGTPSECDKKYCTIYRQEYLDPPGEIQHFYRSCEDKPSYLNAVIQTPNHKAYYRACDENLCNVGDGLSPFAKTFSDNSSNTEIYEVPGIGSSGEISFVSLGKLVISAIVAFVLTLQ